jgi:hypothetical protein
MRSNLRLSKDQHTQLVRRENTRSSKLSAQENMKLPKNKLEESPSERNTVKDSQKMCQHLGSMRSRPRFKKAHNTQSMRRESIKLKELLVQVNMKRLKNKQKE